MSPAPECPPRSDRAGVPIACPQDGAIQEIKERLEKVSDFWHFNIGHVLSILTPIVIVALAWGSLVSTVNQHTKEIADLQVGRAENRDRLAQGDRLILDRLTLVEIQVGRLATALEFLSRGNGKDRTSAQKDEESPPCKGKI